MKKRISILSLCFVLIFSMSVTCTAGAYSSDEETTVKTNMKPALLDTQTVMDESGAVITIKTYNDNGVISKTYDVNIEQGQGTKVMFDKVLSNIVEQDAINGLSDTMATTALKEKNFNSQKTAGTSGTQLYCKARQIGTFYGGPNGNKTILGVKNTRSLAEYANEDIKPSKMTIQETVTFSGLNMAISWPPSWSGSSNSATWNSQPYTNCYVAISYWPTISIDQATLSSSMTCSTRSDIYFGNRSYAAVVTNTQRYAGSW